MNQKLQDKPGSEYRDFTKLTERNEPAEVTKDDLIRSHEALHTFRDYNKLTDQARNQTVAETTRGDEFVRTHQALNTFPTGLDLGLRYRHEARHPNQEKSDFESRQCPESSKSPNVRTIRVRPLDCDCKEFCSLNH